jgi:L-amino acid N-acyltransferase YncA
MNHFTQKLNKNYRIRAMHKDDWAKVRLIYLEGIATGNATFETIAPIQWEEWDKKYLPHCRFVAESDKNEKNENKILGWAMLTPVSSRSVFAGVAEVSIYVAKVAQRQGIGFALLSKLISDSKANNIWTLQAGIFPENLASLSMHEKCGFRTVGLREKIGKLHGKWHDMLLLERRNNLL